MSTPDPVADRSQSEPPRAADAAAPTSGHAGNDSTVPSTGLHGLSAALGLEPGPPATDPLPGMVIAGVRIVQEIGAGGMGRVYEGWQEQPARKVAVKVMRPGLAAAEADRRFRREAEILGQLEHPGIARIFAAGTFDLLGTPLPFFVMEYIPEARTIIDHAEAARLSLDERLALFTAACDAVACGHARGIVHRDLKPANILVAADGRPRVIDFGVARWRDETAAAEPMTVTGQFVGTLQYTSPEQCGGRPDAVDARSDVYALGVVLHELLTGRPPYAVAGLGPVEAARVVCERVPPPARSLNRGIPRGIDRVIARCLRKDPGERFADAAALAAAVRSPAVERTPSRRAVIAAAVAGLTATGLGLWVAARDAKPAERKVAFDLRQPPGPEFVSATNAKIYREPFGAATYWAPIRQREWAEVVYRLESPFPIADVALDRFQVEAWNRHNVANFDPQSAVHLEISPDGEHWTEVTSSTPAGGIRSDPAFAAAVRGARQAFFRARLYETNSWMGNQVHRAQFLRSEPDLGRIPAVKLLGRPR